MVMRRRWWRIEGGRGEDGYRYRYGYWYGCISRIKHTCDVRTEWIFRVCVFFVNIYIYTYIPRLLACLLTCLLMRFVRG